MPTEEKVPETDKAKGKQPVDKDAPASSDAAKAKDGPVLPTGMLAQESTHFLLCYPIPQRS